ncbi:MAG: DNA-3-methyladenine glycosylase I [Chloroflexota bacterium]|nr:DNA-3-methyladenine glycosylase I [Chloroflexota bacterium]
MTSIQRCGWAGEDPLMIEYHDREWGTPLRDDRRLFEFLILEGAQAGLSWQTILRKREGYRRAFAEFDPGRVALFTEADVERLMANPEIVRNRQKIHAAIGNARACLAVHEEEGSFSGFIWSFTTGAPLNPRRASTEDTPARSTESENMSRELRRRGFKFVGPTICYAFMQAAGLVNDHTTNCFRHVQVQEPPH